MEIVLRTMGQTSEPYLRDGMAVYLKRLKRYIRFSVEEIPDLRGMKNQSPEGQNRLEGQELLRGIQPTDYVVLLDEQGERRNSRGFAELLQKWMNRGPHRIVFLIGGPFGFDQAVYARADFKLSLSDMTFSHQMIRLFFTEQVYRAFTILKNEPYHHD